ncbi:nucleotide exchange factor GrpE [Nocardioides sp.]|uniref:nucleotide exchange factor GrpE n=1 Tax=Nocardioides sp. TaxID=35761 RepID=UPI002719BF37|nr:nucleotide exchange factor GrpE [Nocardioides sp.]MDO9456991.1 nucleotide exchange factor GrpE [Nocardioides sp.]
MTERPEDVTPAGEGVEPTPFPDGEMANEPFETGAERPPQGPTEVEAPLPVDEVETTEPADDELTLARIALEERTLDLQRLQAEYLNYKRRVERDRDLVKQNATYAALAPITEVLDTIDRARESAQQQGLELEDGLKTVADQLERTVAGLGLTKFGTAGDPFDPTIHEALSHIGQDPEVTVTTCKVVAKAGYKIGDRVVRAAQVLVVDPADS